MHPINSGLGPHIDLQDSELHWWTFASGKMNFTFQYALQSLLPEARIIMDNFRLRLRSDSLTDAQFRLLFQEPQQAYFWTGTARWQSIAALLPAYRLSKFQPPMPDCVQHEFVAEFLLNLNGVQQWLSKESCRTFRTRRLKVGSIAFRPHEYSTKKRPVAKLREDPQL